MTLALVNFFLIPHSKESRMKSTSLGTHQLSDWTDWDFDCRLSGKIGLRFPKVDLRKVTASSPGGVKHHYRRKCGRWRIEMACKENRDLP